MARRSRSKQNKSGKSSSSKGKSSSSKGKSSSSKGKSSSSKGKSSSGSKNSRGSGNKSKQSQNKSTSTKSTSTKSTSTKSTSPSGNKRGSGQAGQGTAGGGQKTNPTKRTTTVSTKTTQTKSPTKTVSTKTKQGKDKTPAQIAASKRLAEGKTISQVKADNKQKMQDAARIRDQKFKQTGVQTLGGKKTSFTKAEQAKIRAAGYTVDGYSKAAARSDADVASFRKAAEAKAAAEAAARKAADEKLARQFDPSRLYAGTEYDNYVASLPEGVRNDMMIGGQTRSPLSEAAIAAGTIFGGKALLSGGLSALGIGGGAKGLGYKGVQAGFTGMGKKGFDAITKGAKYIASKKPQILGKGAYSAPTFKGAQRYAGTTGSLGGAQTPGGVIKSIVPGKASRIGFIESQAKVPSATFDKGVQLANKLSAGNYGSSTLANTLRSQMVSGVAPGGGIGSNLGNIAKQTGVATAVAGGLNIGSSGGVDSGEASDKPSGLARVIAGGADKIMRDTTDFDKRGKEKNFLADAFTQTNTALKTIKPYFDAAKGQDDKSIRKQASNLLTDIGAKEELAPVARGIKAFTTDNPNVPNKFGMETLSDIRDTFTPGKPKIPSIDPKSGIVMSIGNRMLAGDLKNIVKEADQQTGVEKGATRTLGQTINVGRQIAKNLGDTGTQGYKSGQKIAKLVGTGSGKPTPGSILSGVNPFRGSNRGGGTTPIRRATPALTGGGGGGGTPVGQVPQVPPTTQFQVPELPVQQGLDAGNLANIQNESYQNTFKNLMAINPNYSARFQMRRRRGGRRGSFRRSFSRRFFS